MRLKPAIVPDGSIVMNGLFVITHKRNGKEISRVEIHNTATTTGKAEVAGLINEATSGGFKWLALDASSTAATAADTALVTEITANDCGRAAATCTRVTTDDTNDTAQLVHTWTASGTQAVRGVGVFDTSTASGGIMIGRTTFATKNMIANDLLIVTYKINVD